MSRAPGHEREHEPIVNPNFDSNLWRVALGARSRCPPTPHDVAFGDDAGAPSSQLCWEDRQLAAGAGAGPDAGILPDVATVRLFANLRETAGTGKLEMDVATVGEALERLSAEYGERFDRGLARARVWKNGDPAEPGMSVDASDEIAIIPPVSGGATPVLTDGIPVPAVAGAAALLVAAIANAFDSPAFFIAALVGLLGVWGVDLVAQSKLSGTGMRAAPLLLALFGGTTSGWWFANRGAGAAGLGVAIVGAVVLTLLLASFRPVSRSVMSVTTTALVASYGAAAGAGLAAIRLAEGGQRMVWLFLMMVVVGSLASSATRVVRSFAVVDPLVAGAIGTILAGLLAALALDLAVVGFLFVSVLVALALIAGRALGSLGRTGEPFLAEALPGNLASLDGSVLAGAVYLFAITFFV